MLIVYMLIYKHVDSLFFYLLFFFLLFLFSHLFLLFSSFSTDLILVRYITDIGVTSFG